jgi:large-conductance mechanosensitive channel
MDDTPKGFLDELRGSILRRTVGQIAIAVVLAEAAWKLVSSLTWYLILPMIARALRGNTESVLFSKSTSTIRWDNLVGSLLEFGLTVILVFYLNRWVKGRPSPTAAETEFSSSGDALSIPITDEVANDPSESERPLGVR